MRKIRLVCLIIALTMFTTGPLVRTAASQTSDRQVTILHTSGTLNRIQEFGPPDEPAQGGAARWAAFARQVRETHPNALLMSPGDDVMGTTMFAQYGGIVSADVMTRVGYNVTLATETDIMAGGNTD